MRVRAGVSLGVLLCLIAAAGCPIRAQETPASEYREREPARDAGSVEGRVTSLDRMRGRMVLQTPHGRYDIVVLPSTAIAEEGGEFHTIADLRRDQRVQVLLSKREGVYFAQLIRLRGTPR